MKKTALTIGRFQLLHKGHCEYIFELLTEFDFVVIAIGSCYEYGTSSNNLLALDREKMLRKVLSYEKVNPNKFTIIHIQDYSTFDEWLQDVLEIRDFYQVTHFVTGNQKDILSVLESKNIQLNMELINPELSSSSSIHASDIRKLIVEGHQKQALDHLHPAVVETLAETKIIDDILDNYANVYLSSKFVPGRQAVDVVFFIEDSKSKKTSLLCGSRSMQKENFPGCLAIPGGGIDKFESPISAAVRELAEETGLQLIPYQLATEPALFILEGTDNITKLHFVKLYSTTDQTLGGNQGGSSQAFAAIIRCHVDRINELITSTSDLEHVSLLPVRIAIKQKFAYQQSEMILDAINKLHVMI